MKHACWETMKVELGKLEDMVHAMTEQTFIPSRSSQELLKQIKCVKKSVAVRHKQVGSGGNKNSGLQKPMSIKPEMAKFAKWDKNELHSRVDVTKIFCQYIAEKNLQQPDNKRNILIDGKMKKLLHYTEDVITYPHLQKYLKHVFASSP